MEKHKIAEFSYDLHSALGDYETPELDYLKTLGMAATLSVHIRGLGEIGYDVLKLCSFHYFKISSFALDKVIFILEDLEFIDVIGSKTRIKAIIPKVPHFNSVYRLIGDYTEVDDLNNTESTMLAILNQVYNKPENKQRLINIIDSDNTTIESCLRYSETGGLLRNHKARGKEIILSPYYFADNLDGLADLTAKSGSHHMGSVLTKLKANQGWPLSLAMRNKEIGGTNLCDVELNLLESMASEGILKPPSIKFGAGKLEQFIFTPSPGSARLDISNREVYERAMALVSCVRKGQLLPKQFRIRSPVAILNSLRNKGFLNSNTEANEQYKNLVFMKVAQLQPVTSNRSKLVLIRSDENVKALDIAINLLNTGELANLEVNDSAKVSFSKDEAYIQSIVSSSAMRKRQQVELTLEAKSEMDSLFLSLDV